MHVGVFAGDDRCCGAVLTGDHVSHWLHGWAAGLAMQRLVAACLLLAGLLMLSAPVRAGVLYRCTGSSGETVFSSTSAGYQGCARVAGAPDPVRRKPQPKTPAASLSSVVGAAETTARTVPEAAPLKPASLTQVEATVETTARAVPLAGDAKPRSGKPGQWSYSEAGPAGGSSVPDKQIADAPPAGDRVLRGAVYRVVHGDGSVEYTNLRPAQQGKAVTMLFSYIATCVACNLHSNIHWDSVALDLTDYADVIELASRESGVNEAFLRAIIHAESAFNPRAMSIKGAQGLMQLMPGTAMDMGVRDAFDTAQNIRGGARYLGLLLRTFNGDERLAAAAYNAGPAAVQRYNGVPPYGETQVYVERVGTLRKRYGQAARPSSGRVPVVAGISAIQ